MPRRAADRASTANTSTPNTGRTSRPTWPRRLAASQAGGFIDEQFAEEWFSEHGEGIAGGWDVALRDKELDGDGVVGEVIFPDADAVTGVAGAPFGAGLGQSGDLDPGRAMAGARAHNRWLAELCSHSPERRAGVAVVPILADIDAAVAEITRAAESGLRGGILIPARWVGYPPYHDRRYDKVWAACQDLQMPVHTHSGPAPQEEYGGHLGIYVTEVRWWGARPLWFALWSGVFERFPRLRWGVTECGAFWANDLLWLMDTRYLREHSAKKMSHLMEGDLTMPPSAYFDRNCFIGATTTERRELARRYEIGVSNMLVGQRLSPSGGDLAAHPRMAASLLLGHSRRGDPADAGPGGGRGVQLRSGCPRRAGRAHRPDP